MQELTYTDLINDEVKQTLLEYKYNGKDDSILYEKVISPLCQFIVDKWLPESLAPNTITIIGFIINLIPFVFLLCYSEPGEPTNAFLCIFQGIGIILYVICDNCDGKQARKIGASSPLGMMFDHGCDAVTTGIIAMSLCMVVSIGKVYAMIVMALCIFLFFLANLEQ